MPLVLLSKPVGASVEREAEEARIRHRKPKEIEIRMDYPFFSDGPRDRDSWIEDLSRSLKNQRPVSAADCEPVADPRRQAILSREYSLYGLFPNERTIAVPKA